MPVDEKRLAELNALIVDGRQFMESILDQLDRPAGLGGMSASTISAVAATLGRMSRASKSKHAIDDVRLLSIELDGFADAGRSFEQGWPRITRPQPVHGTSGPGRWRKA
jgi:hypothetical protein